MLQHMEHEAEVDVRRHKFLQLSAQVLALVDGHGLSLYDLHSR